MMAATTSLTWAWVHQLTRTLSTGSSVWWAWWHVLFMLLLSGVRLMRSHHWLTLSRFIDSAATRHVCLRELNRALRTSSNLTALTCWIYCSYTTLQLLRWRGRCSYCPGTRHIWIWSILVELMSQNIILLIGLVPYWLHHGRCTHHIHIIWRRRRHLWNLSKSILWSLKRRNIIILLPIGIVLWAPIGRLALFSSCKPWIRLSIHKWSRSTIKRNSMDNSTVMVCILCISSLLLMLAADNWILVDGVVMHSRTIW